LGSSNIKGPEQIQNARSEENENQAGIGRHLPQTKVGGFVAANFYCLAFYIFVVSSESLSRQPMENNQIIGGPDR
jgi:hypothetical protein